MTAAMTTSAPIFADDTTEIVNGQINLGAAIRVVVQVEGDATPSATASSAGTGNALTVDVIEPHDVESRQEFSGSVEAEAVSRARAVDGAAITTASAIGNGATLLADDDLSLDSEQVAADGSSVSATAGLEIDDYAVTSVTAASASANAVDSITYGGDTELDLRQDSGADVTADAYIAARTGGIGEAATLASTASGNTASAQGYYQGPSQVVSVDQDNRGDILARARIEAGGGGVITTAVAQANGNTAQIQNEDAYAHLQGEQDNVGEVRAVANAEIGNFDVDVVTLSSEGVGNSALISNFGSDIFMGPDQTNNGGVSAVTRIRGDQGGVGIGNATAFGNAATGYICSECPVTATGDMNQVNSAAISARTTVSTNSSTALIGSAFAVGNSATFESVRPGQ